MIIIIGAEEEFHSKYMFDYLNRANNEAVFLDTRAFPTMSWSCSGKRDYIIIDDKKIYNKDIKSIYWRWHYGIYDKNPMIQCEKQSLFDNFLFSLENKCWNSISAINLHRTKGYQSKIMKDNKIRIPKTLITNDKLALEKFYFANNKNIIYKPVRGGGYTKKFTNEDLLRTDLLKNCPCQLQELVEGVDIRVYAFNSGEVFGAEMRTDSLDFRLDENVKAIPVELPKKVQKDCLKVMKLLNLKYSGIDIRLNKNEEYVFIEANPAPMFYYFEKISGFPITETLAKNLTNNVC